MRARRGASTLSAMKRFIMAVEGPNLSDIEEIELPELPSEGTPIETRYGTYIVSETEELTENDAYDGKIVCRLPEF
jgi:hypothetical protein